MEQKTRRIMMNDYIRHIKKVIYSDPVTVVIWDDGTKTISRCDDTDVYDELTGFMLCVFKKVLSAKDMRKAFDKYVYDIDSDKIKWESYPTWLEEEWIDEEIVKGTLDDKSIRGALNEEMIHKIFEDALKYYRMPTSDKEYKIYAF